jgi:hypothetical protein
MNKTSFNLIKQPKHTASSVPEITTSSIEDATAIAGQAETMLKDFLPGSENEQRKENNELIE